MYLIGHDVFFDSKNNANNIIKCRDTKTNSIYMFKIRIKNYPPTVYSVLRIDINFLSNFMIFSIYSCC